MTDNRTTAAAQSDMSRVWDKLNAHDSHLSELTTIVKSSVKRQEQQSDKLDRIERAVTEHTASQGPGLAKLLGILLMMFGLAAGLSTGVGYVVSSQYEGRIVTLEKAAERGMTALAMRDAEDRSELVRLRREDQSRISDRLQRMEMKLGWAATTSSRSR